MAVKLKPPKKKHKVEQNAKHTAENKAKPKLNRRRNFEDYPVMLDASNIQAILRISRANVYKLINSGAFPTLNIGKRILVERDDLVSWIRANKAN
ncbi:MAG: helix-turn-helix domain-containing protein [Oscillospiraceae bacterium]|nr:helix-turn-helix domain-containing protein [Oscillospiraceae bacterium]